MQRISSNFVIMETSTDDVTVGLKNKETIAEDQRFFYGGKGGNRRKTKGGQPLPCKRA